MDTVLWNRAIDVVNDDLEATQVWFFTHDGKEIFKLANCYIDPPIPMNWNVNGCFDAFPPHNSEENLDVHNFDLTYILTHCTTLSGGFYSNRGSSQE